MPKSFLSTLKAGFFSLAQTGLETALFTGPSAPWHGIPSEAADVDHGQFVGRRLSHVAFVVDLHEVSPVGRWATGGRDGWWFERFAEMCKDLPDRPRIGNERDESDVATTPRARKRKLLAHPSHEFGPGTPGCVVRAWLFMSVAAAFHGMSADSPAGGLPAGGGVAG